MATFVGYGIDTLLTMAWQELTAPETMGDELEAVAEMMAGLEHLIGQVIDVTRYLCGRDPDGG